MIEKNEHKDIIFDDIKLTDAILVDLDEKLMTIMAPFQEKTFQDRRYVYENTLIGSYVSIGNKYPTIDVEVVGTVITLDVRQVLKEIQLGKGNYRSYVEPSISMREVEEISPEIFIYLESKLNPEYLDTANELTKKLKERRKNESQELYNKLYNAYEELGYQKDIKFLKEIDTLTYCEAETLLNKRLNLINKKQNAKNIKLWNILNPANEVDCTY